MQPGDVVFFKRARDSINVEGSATLGPFVEFTGHGFGVLLGHYPKEAPLPSLPVVMVGLTSIGFVSINDIIELAGQETAAKIAQAVAVKYMGPNAKAVLSSSEKKAPGLQLVRPDGGPVQ